MQTKPPPWYRGFGRRGWWFGRCFLGLPKMTETTGGNLGIPLRAVEDWKNLWTFFVLSLVCLPWILFVWLSQWSAKKNRFPYASLKDVVHETWDVSVQSGMKSCNKEKALIYLRHFAEDMIFFWDFFPKKMSCLVPSWLRVVLFSASISHIEVAPWNSPFPPLKVPVPSSHPSCSGEVFERVEACGGGQAGLNPQLFGTCVPKSLGRIWVMLQKSDKLTSWGW